MRTLFGWVLILGVSMQLPVLADDLCRRDEKRVLFAIDQICGDTWCEGDYNFQFRRIRCNYTLGTCVLEYRTAPWKSAGDEDYDWGKNRICVIRNVNSLDQLIRADQVAASLREGPYEQITTCIDHLSPRHTH
ncbi:MAG: hypothetical protein KGP28_04765 [Bdellovibrionales bacterium]|nr:hypothetical protein [Bdellovibrionales bacterium]